ncbi:hypothetical protein HZA44_03400, partial [Candidatus Peregrinibacteria bacterium]|nr:hypothetical protein [Candidatus Peregrinibacteria bacterium]
MKENLFHVLTNLGLEDKEAQLYVSLVVLGEASVLALSRKSGVNRASIYYILDKMKKRGLVTHLKKKGTDLYSSVDPDLVLAQFQSRVQDLQAAVPELKALVNQNGQRPHVRFYEGLNGIKAMLADSLTAKTEILSTTNPETLKRLWPEYDEEYSKRRATGNLPLRALAPNDEHGRKAKTEDKKFNRELRLVDPNTLSLGSEITIYDDKVAMTSLTGELFGVLIENPAL